MGSIVIFSKILTGSFALIWFIFSTKSCFMTSADFLFLPSKAPAESLIFWTASVITVLASSFTYVTAAVGLSGFLVFLPETILSSLGETLSILDLTSAFEMAIDLVFLVLDDEFVGISVKEFIRSIYDYL